MKYFLDSSVIIAAGPSLTSTKLDKIRDQAIRENISFITTELVITEVVNKFRESVLGHLDSITSGSKHLYRTVGVALDLELPASQVDAWTNEYESKVRSLFSTETKGVILPFPSVSHEEVAKRAVESKRPYVGKSKDGYRDTIIWYSFLEVVESDRWEHVCLLTSNTKDFCADDSDRVLHDDLIADVKEHNGNAENVSVVKSLDYLMHRYTESRIAEILSDLANIEVGDWPHRNIEADICRVVDDYLESNPLEVSSMFGELAATQAHEWTVFGVDVNELGIMGIHPDFGGSGVVIEVRVILDVPVEFEAAPDTVFGQKLNGGRAPGDDWIEQALDYEAGCEVDLHYTADWGLSGGNVRFFGSTGYPEDEWLEDDTSGAESQSLGDNPTDEE